MRKFTCKLSEEVFFEFVYVLLCCRVKILFNIAFFFEFVQLFYYSHHLYVVWWIALILHAPNFWKWFIVPAVLYFIERLLRLRIVNRARFGKTIIEEGITLPSKVHLYKLMCQCNLKSKPTVLFQK